MLPEWNQNPANGKQPGGVRSFLTRPETQEPRLRRDTGQVEGTGERLLTKWPEDLPQQAAQCRKCSLSPTRPEGNSSTPRNRLQGWQINHQDGLCHNKGPCLCPCRPEASFPPLETQGSQEASGRVTDTTST